MPTNEPCIIATHSSSANVDCYYDGHGFTRLRENAMVYPNEDAAEDALLLMPAIDSAGVHSAGCWIETGTPTAAAPVESFEVAARNILDDRAASFWLKDALTGAMRRDPVDALADASVLVSVLTLRSNEALKG